MKLGILVNSDNNLDEVTGLTRAAVFRGHQVTIFAMDEGTRLLGMSPFLSLVDLEGVAISYCDHSAIELSVKTDERPERIERSSQYNNAAMNHSADKVIVL